MWNAKWIVPRTSMGDVAPEFCRDFALKGPVREVQLYVTAMGVYELTLNGARVGNYVLAPGWTCYYARHQYQQYDLTDLVMEHNTLRVLVGRGWYSSTRIGRKYNQPDGSPAEPGLIAQLEILYQDGTREQICTDGSWQVRESFVRYSEIYFGEKADGRVENAPLQPVKLLDKGTETLIPQEGEIVCEQDRVAARRLFRTPKGELLVDFGQEVTGYVEFTVTGKSGDRVRISHGEMLDRDGNFYNANYRNAKPDLHYICRDGVQTYKPHLTFFGFRYILLEEFPGEPRAEDFTAIAVSSQLRRTGYLRTGVPLVNRLFENILWGQKGNFLDIPTDCPQRDERLGWTGDAQVFVKTASYNYDVDKFFRKWLGDLSADQWEDGCIPLVCPLPHSNKEPSSAAWAEACIICPWQMYMTYGDKELLERQYDSMCAYVDYITNSTTEPYLWLGGKHFGDWLGLDAPSGSYKGSTRDDFIASAFYALDTAMMAQISEILGKDGSRFAQLHEKIVEKFRKTFPDYRTQTEMVLALMTGLAEDPQATADRLAQHVADSGHALKTGFVGTAYILYELSKYGHGDTAYDLLLRQEYPGWLYCVNKGATTVWEHWDGIMEDGSFWSPDMNSFNHYAYGAVAGWIYEEAAGIHPAAPGFAKVCFAPHPDPRLGWLEASIDTVSGRVSAGWYYEQEGLRFEIHTPVAATFERNGKVIDLKPGDYLFFE